MYNDDDLGQHGFHITGDSDVLDHGDEVVDDDVDEEGDDEDEDAERDWL